MRHRAILIGVIATMVLGLAIGGVEAKKKASADCTISLSEGSVAAGIGFSWGKGTLDCKGKHYPISVDGLTVGSVGVAKILGRGQRPQPEEARGFRRDLRGGGRGCHGGRRRQRGDHAEPERREDRPALDEPGREAHARGVRRVAEGEAVAAFVRDRVRRRALPVLAAALVALATAAGAAPRRGGDTFVVEDNGYLLGQAPDWIDRTHVVWHEPMVRDEDGDGETHVYRSRLDGAERTCLTCGLAGPNQVPVVQPHGRWIAFHSWNGHAFTIGGPGFGGLGSDVWVMTASGARRTNLTPSSEMHDNFHAYWSPDGRYLVWTALNWNTDEGGNGRSDIRVARFDPSGPRLVDEHAVRPPNGHWYETQWWAPDGSGFLYTETADTAVNPELFFCRLPDRAGGKCRPVRLTTDPAWDEQAVFTSDMNRIVFMSSRHLPGAHNDWAAATALLGIPADYDYALILPVFLNNFLQPILEQATDLYEITLRWNRARTRFKTGPIRRLTQSGDDGWVIPEFAWDPSGHRLLWTQNKFAEGRRVDQGCLVRQIRDDIIAKVSGVQSILQVPLTLDQEIREAAASLVRDPRSVAFQGRGCGGHAPDQQPSFAQATRIGRYVR